MDRFQKSAILKDLQKKIVLLVGPRQAGKTWLAKDIGKLFKHTVYLNYDNIQDREIIQRQAWLQTTELIILDELHKMPRWKNYLKGIFDTKSEHLKILVTGSARLDIYNKLGDSLAGRYFVHHLLPFSPAELQKTGEKTDLNHLLVRSGFPEPYLAENDIEANRWRIQYIDSLIRTDIFDIENIHHLREMQLIFELLRARVGSPVSYQSIAEDVHISANTVKKYIQVLEAIYVIFRVTPFSNNISRSLRKEPKIYFYDTGLVKGDDGVKIENLVAISLLKHVYAKIDYKAQNYTLHTIRTKDKEEVDFALVKANKIEQIIEVKHADKDLSKSLLKFHKKYNLPAVQIVKDLRQEQIIQGIPIQKAIHYLEALEL